MRPADATESTIWAVLRREDAHRLAPSADERLVSAEGLAALLGPSGADRVTRCRRLLAHARRADLLPVSPRAAAGGPEAAARWAAAASPAFRARLDHLGGRLEYIVEARADKAQRAPTRPGATPREEGGAGWLRRRAREAEAERRDALARADGLERLAAQLSRRLGPAPARLMGDRARPTLSLLLDPTREAAFIAAVDHASRALRDALTLSASGPWPTFSFADGAPAAPLGDVVRLARPDQREPAA